MKLILTSVSEEEDAVFPASGLATVWTLLIDGYVGAWEESNATLLMIRLVTLTGTVLGDCSDNMDMVSVITLSTVAMAILLLSLYSVFRNSPKAAYV